MKNKKPSYEELETRVAELESKVRECRLWENKLKHIGDNIRDGFMFMDNQGTYVYGNKAAMDMLGYVEEQIIGIHGPDIMPDFMHPDDITFTGARAVEALTTGKRTYAEFRYRSPKDGSWRWATQEAFPWTGPDGEILGVGAVSREITEDKRSEEEKQELQRQLLQSQKMEAVGAMAGGIAHDFNNLLTIIMLSAGHAVTETKHDQLTHSLLEKIMSASERARKLTMNLLSFARKTLPDLQAVSANQIVSDLVSILERGISKKVEIRVTPAEGLNPIFADPYQIEQALMNLCINAADAMPEGGVLTIETCLAGPDQLRLFHDPGLCRPGECCMITVSDTGKGMSEEVKPRAFEPFFTTKDVGRGTGLGLSVTFAIVQNHCGGICIDSNPGAGTSVRILVPLASDEDVARKRRQSPQGPLAGNETVLVVDDEELIAEIVRAILVNAGYKVHKAVSGAEGLELFNKRHKEIDLVIMDIIMPGMYGDELYRQIRKRKPDQKILVFSGFSAKGAVENMDIQGFAQKPFEPEEFFAAVRRALDS